MPYNNTAIPPRQDIRGQATLPLARVKKIIQQDEDIELCSKNAAFALTIATEMFVQYIAQQGHNVVKTERKPRKNIQYKDLANAVARIDNLEFLSDVVPRTTTFKAYKAKKARRALQARVSEQAPGQTTLDGKLHSRNGVNGVSRHEESVDMVSEDEEDQARNSRRDEAEDDDEELQSVRSVDGEEEMDRVSDTDMGDSVEEGSR